MDSKKQTVVLFFVLLCTDVRALEQEPLCLSRYDYDYKILRNIVMLEQKIEELQKAMESQKDVIGKQEHYVQELQIAIESEKAVNNKQEQEIEKMRTSQKDVIRQLGEGKKDVTPGSTYVRWGRTSCPGNGTETVYTGYAAGSHYTQTGAAANYLCLPTEPLWGEYDDSKHTTGYVYGAEYEIFRSYSDKLFKKNLGENDVPCAVCRSVRTSVLMIPARNACYDGWSVEYTGYLFAGYHGHAAASEYVCLDGDPEVIANRQSDHNGKLFYPTESVCGSLPCPPYVDGRELTCVVCAL